MADTLYLDILPREQLRLFEILSSQLFIHDFYLAGGTCLALQIGHRRSIDFDFFSPAEFNTPAVINTLTEIGSCQRGNEERNTINGSLNGVRISFFGYRYAIVDEFRTFSNLRLTGLKDIAAMKLEAIAGRGSKKDFIDLFFLLQHFTLEGIFAFHTQKYGPGLGNQYHHLKSLVYFADAEEEVMPLMVIPMVWEDMKRQIISMAKSFQLS